MNKAFIIPLRVVSTVQINPRDLKRIFIDFDGTYNSTYNQTGRSKFRSDIEEMNEGAQVTLEVGSNSDQIQVFFLFSDIDSVSSSSHITVILHAIATFSNLFPKSYSGLKMYISLDDNRRSIETEMSNSQKPCYMSCGLNSNCSHTLSSLQSNSKAFNVGGLSNKTDRTIIITRKEEIIKLIFHELIHFAGLDRLLARPNPDTYGLSVDVKSFILAETFTETLSIILFTAYQALHIASNEKTDFRYDPMFDWTYDPMTNRDLFYIMLESECYYSMFLTVSILKFYGYDSETYVDFFKGAKKSNPCPVLVWEYILLRAQLFYSIKELSSLLDPGAEVTDSNVNEIKALMRPTNAFISSLKEFFILNESPSITYTLIQIDLERIF